MVRGKKSSNKTDTSKKNLIPGTDVKSWVGFRQLWEKAQDFVEVLVLGAERMHENRQRQFCYQEEIDCLRLQLKENWKKRHRIL